MKTKKSKWVVVIKEIKVLSTNLELMSSWAGERTAHILRRK
jgi:hypothetical protein